jgi:Membrane-bound toxin component of toxin-antitoxin system
VTILPSPLGATVLGALHALAACAALVALPAAAALVCVLGVALSAGACVSALLQWSPDSVRELTLRPDGSAAWRDRGGSWHVAQEVTGGVIAPWLAVVGLKEDGRGMRRLLLMPDAMQSEAFRELRVWLRWRPTSGTRAGVT